MAPQDRRPDTRFKNRRQFLASAVIGAGAVSCAASTSIPISHGAKTKADRSAPASGFKLKYAPHFGMFKHHAGENIFDQLKFMADEGFTALEDNGLSNRSVADQEKLGHELQRLKMQMGVFVVNFGTAFGKQSFVNNDPEMISSFLKDCRNSVEVAKRVQAKWMTVVPGEVNPKLPYDMQMANAIDMLKRGAEIFEPHGLTMVLEPLNGFVDHPNMFLTKISQAYQICRAVNSPACKILDDLYHQQITEGHLISNMDAAWSEIAYFQVGDVPGRKEPTTGEINYKNVFRHIYQKGFQGIVGMEHGNFSEGKSGERAVINAYRECDSFQA